MEVIYTINKMYHKPEDHSTSTDDVALSASLLEVVEPELYTTFLNFQESLMRPYRTPSGKYPTDGTYEQMLPVAAQLASAAASLAAAEIYAMRTSKIND